ncbi:MAG: molybdopterin-dependent oxidoreductase [Actinomycetia bacterium]|nr:molybdopterin-dependent oxidoreductase [Actinomycetes bacterium]
MSAPPRPGGSLPADIALNPRLSAWLGVADGVIELRVGKVELGQGILTALAQLAADALGVPLERLRVRASSTDGPDQGMTAGSMSVQQSAPALRHIGAVVRALAGPPDRLDYLDRVAALDPDLDLTTFHPGDAGDPSGTKQPSRAPARAGASPSDRAPSVVETADAPARAAIVGHSVPRLDLPDKTLGRPRFITDLRPAGLFHGRVLRPPSPAARLAGLADDWSAPGVTLVRDGSFLGLIGAREDGVDRALAALAAACRWTERDSLPDERRLPEYLRGAPNEATVLADDPLPEPTRVASYSKPYLAHASIAPSAALARWSADGERVEVVSHTQGVFRLRDAIAAALGLDLSRVRVRHGENGGCYGHNGADDAAFDAVLLARAVPGAPVLARWSRSDELTWGPLSPAMTGTVSATLAGGRIRGWGYELWSQGHMGRPGTGQRPGLLADAHRADGMPFQPSADPPPTGDGGSTRNAIPGYALGPTRIVGHRLLDAPLRASAMRSLGSYFNVFVIESFMDELAADAGQDPVAFRLAHTTDPRARAVIELAATRAGWGEPLADSVGRGIGFARYKTGGAWCAVVAEVEARTALRVRRLVVAADLGQVVNPNGARNQLSGGAVQSTSWTTVERVRFDRRRVTSSDWERYPILRFPDSPAVDVHLVGSDAPPLGAGEAAQGPTAAAIANAVHDALGVRVRDLPVDAAAIERAIARQ